MKLGNFLRAAGSARPINPRPVTFHAKGRDEQMRLVKAKVEAVFIFVDEDQREELRVRAREVLHKKFGERPIPDGVMRDEEAYQLLFDALHEAEPNKDGQHPRLADTIDELRGSLVLRECRRLNEEYEQYVAEEFPPTITDEEWSKLVEEAKKNSASDLLTSCGYEKAISVMSFLAGRSSR
jgi:hypothetical protein